jgi:hypothetical protein
VPKRGYTRRLWTPEEDRVIDRYARKLSHGRYRTASDASRACAIDIKRLHRSQLRADPNHHVASRERPFLSLRQRMMLRIGTLGLRWASRYLTSAEERVVGRHVRGLVDGSYHDARQAARACAGALAQLRVRGRTQPLSFTTIHRRIYARAHGLSRPWARTKWSSGDMSIAERYARAVVRGEYATLQDAALACHRELAGLNASAAGEVGTPRSLGAVRARMDEIAWALGRTKSPRWSDAEQRVVNRYLRALYAGRFPYIRPAADACARELQRLSGCTTGRSRARRDSAGRRTADAVYHAMVQKVMNLGLPRYKGESTPDELRLFEKYAREVSAGRFRDCIEAARACVEELRLLYAEAGRRSSLLGVRLAQRTPKSIRNQIIQAARRLGLHIPGSRWGEDENKVVRGWLRWYDKYRHVRRMEPLKTSSQGLQEDLEKIGSNRTVVACQFRLVEAYRHLHGLA